MSHRTTAPLNNTNPPTDVYGGDEVFALVLDPGYAHTRAGFAGEDVPKVVLPSSYAHYPNSTPAHSRYGDEFLLPREGLEVRNYMSRDSIVEDWDTAEKMWENMLLDRLQPSLRRSIRDSESEKPAEKKTDVEGDVSMNDETTTAEAAAAAEASTEAAEAATEANELLEKPLAGNPLLMTEAPWNTAKSREKAMEIMMETWGAPAFWFSKTPVLAAFTAGKATALVIDIGASGSSVVAVHDGMILKRSVTRSPVGGLWLSKQARALISTHDSNIDLTPAFLVESKTPVDANTAPSFTSRKLPFTPTPSYLAYEEERLVSEFKETVVESWRGPTRLSTPGVLDNLRMAPGRIFEFPTGYNTTYREARFQAAEGLWDETAAIPVAGVDPLTKPQTIPEMVKTAIAGVDADLRTNLLSNVVVTGGGSLINGFSDRLNAELSAVFPGVRIRLNAAGLTSERRFGAWVGGSILASLGSFHQMWVSKKEYEEHGSVVVEKRCK